MTCPKTSSPGLRRPIGAKFGIERQTTADENRLAGDIGRVIRSEKGENSGELGRLGGPIHRYVLFHFGAGLRIVDPGAIDRRNHCAWPYPIHTDSVARVFESECSGHVLHPALADRIAEVERLRN